MIINLNQNSHTPENDPQNIEELKLETLETMLEYNTNLVSKLEAMADELRNDIKEDSWEFLRMMIDGFNWVIEAYNNTLDVIDPDHTIFDSKAIEANVQEFGRLYRAKDAAGTALKIEDGIVPFLKKINSIIPERLGS